MKDNDLKIGRLRGAIAQEMKKLGPKLKCYGLDPNILFASSLQTDEKFKIEDEAKRINAFDLFDPEIRLLATIAREFIWGQRTPRYAINEKERVKSKAHTGQPLSQNETLLLSLDTIDTDLF